ncbi:hypothetical protein [Marivirga sp.]|jgi:hypothetical protein|uniref:hypothetical protein n=1 Tax=Marivirga sp. TaxID=2018662 RepID=UPI003DA73233
MQYNIKNKARHLIFNSTIIIGFMTILTACPTPPEFEDVPKIEYEDVEFSIITDTSASGQPLNQDVISVTISFEDGDGDLGLRNSENEPPYHQFDIPLNEERELIYFGSSPDLPPFNYYDYNIFRDSTIINNEVLVNDTVFVRFNERHFNIYVAFFYQPPGSNDFEQFEWETEPGFYQSFHGRFPILNTENYNRPLNGSLTYEMKSVGFRATFRDYPMYLEVYILDRAGNKSNVIQTETFRLIN